VVQTILSFCPFCSQFFKFINPPKEIADDYKKFKEAQTIIIEQACENCLNQK